MSVKNPPSRKFGIPIVLLAGVCWSSGGLIYRLIENASAWQVLFFRSSTLFVMFALWLLIRYKRGIVKSLARAGWPALAGGCCLSVAFTGFILALDRTSVANAMFVLAAAPFFTALFARLILGEWIFWYTWLAMIVAAIGLGIMTSGELKIGGGLGNLFAFCSALGFSGVAISLRAKADTDMLPTILYGSCIASIFAAFAIFVSQTGFVLQPLDLGYSISLGIFQVGFGFFLFTIGARHLPAAELNLLALTEIIVGPILVWVGIGEIPTNSTLIGGVIISLAILLIAFFGAKSAKHSNICDAPSS